MCSTDGAALTELTICIPAEPGRGDATSACMVLEVGLTSTRDHTQEITLNRKDFSLTDTRMAPNHDLTSSPRSVSVPSSLLPSSWVGISLFCSTPLAAPLYSTGALTALKFVMFEG
eukprot:TRINITY_DN9477_c0_g1_i1.p1 TRINITY_DN9477_c0_g1~~TRINITY_DN9477_c0_g1_i1.p1  ORF type:complete len:116 (+),score=0.90 TRINITY_DN9477_c0_g1_i1:106-453(+)